MTTTPSLEPATDATTVACQSFTWRGRTVEVRFEASWLSSSLEIAHLEVETLDPAHAPLPVTETGYRSHFLACGVVEAAGGPVSYATAWLDEAANSPNWRRSEERRRQLDLFERTSK